MSGRLLAVDRFDNFKAVRDFPAGSFVPEVVDKTRDLDEREELEPFLRAILTDTNETPHGPAEIADILTHKLTVDNTTGLAAFILKGKSFSVVRPKHVSHQIYRLEKIAGLRFAVLAVTGNLLDQAKEQFVATVERLGCSYAILDAGDLARLFIAHGFFCPRDGNRIAAGRCRCGYSPRKRLLNILQKEALDELSQAHKLGQKAGLIILPPGSGKTRIAAEDAKALSARRVLYVAHTHEILDVAQSEFAAVFGERQVGRISTGKELLERKRVKLATVQWLKNHLGRVGGKAVDYLIIDEFHHAAAESYRKLMEAVGHPFLLGLTATPFRGDRQDILELCHGNVLVNAELRAGIDSGILAPYHYFGSFDDIDYSRLSHNGLRYSVRDLERALVIPERDRAVIRKWRERGELKPTLAFCCSHGHAIRVAKSFLDHGVAAETYLSTTPQDDRHKLAG
jgi:hypothetical protein